MKALIISDSHGWTRELNVIKERHIHEVDVMIHCGDSELDSSSREMEGFNAVRGNCDYDDGYPNESIHEFGDKKIYTTHGHLHNVKMTLINLAYRAREVGANIVCFGHSHIAGAELVDNILFINPGSIRLPRMRKEGTYVIIEKQMQEVAVTFHDLDGNVVESLTTVVNISE